VNVKANFFSNFINNAMTMRAAWLRRLTDTRKNIESECGHPSEVSIEDNTLAFKRGDMAARIISLYPEECWGNDPVVYETEDQKETEFEKAWTGLQERLRIFYFLHRADVLSGIGRFGVLLLGLNDGKPMSEPVEGLDEMGESTQVPTDLKLLFVRPFDESLIQVRTLQTDSSNPRFGQPTKYSIQFSDEAMEGSTLSSSQTVHWSRIIHLADNRTNSEVYGCPRLERIYNRILDLKKIAGGAGEMFWKGGFPGLSVEAVPVEGEVELDEKATKEQMEAYMDGLQRYIATTGMTVKSLAIQIADPRPHMEIQVRLIAMAIGVPWRILMGVEVGQLASEQDIRVWNRRLQRRCVEYINPFIVRPFVDRLIAFGILPKPAQVKISWPDFNSPTDQDKAAVAEKQTNALAKYVQGGVDTMLPPFHYLTLVLGMTDEEAQAIIDASEKQMAQTDGVSLFAPPDLAPANPRANPALARNAGE
jgi:hypothetical protein